MGRRRLFLLAACVALALLAAACLPPPPPPPPLPSAPVGTAAPATAIFLGPQGSSQAIDFPAPSVLRVDHPPQIGVSVPENPPAPPTYYAYATGSGFAQAQVAQSTDLVHWEWVDDPFVGPDPRSSTGGSTWADLFAHTWAPSTLERPANPTNQRFVMYYASRSKVAGSAGSQCIGRAVSANPVGPFVDTENAPLLCTPERGGSIDPNPFVDTDGRLWLLWKSEGVAAAGEPTRIWSTPLTADGLSVAGPPTELLETLGWSWETPIVEAPTMMPAPDGGYLLFYSAAQWQTADYKVAVAWCATPQSVCSRLYATPVLATRGSLAGPGGESVFQDTAGRWSMAFHAWTAPYIGYPSTPDARYARTLRILPVSFPNGGHNPKVG